MAAKEGIADPKPEDNAKKLRVCRPGDQGRPQNCGRPSSILIMVNHDGPAELFTENGVVTNYDEVEPCSFE